VPTFRSAPPQPWRRRSGRPRSTWCRPSGQPRRIRT